MGYKGCGEVVWVRGKKLIKIALQSGLTHCCPILPWGEEQDDGVNKIKALAFHTLLI